MHEGAALVLVARNEARLLALAADLCASGTANVAAVAMGLEVEAPNAGKHIESWKTQLGGIDHIHLVYGYHGSQPEASASPAELSRIVTSNFTSAVHWCEAAANLLRRQKHGALVAACSVAGDRGRQSNYAYGAAKGGLALYVQGIAHSLAGTGARAVAVKPGFVDTPMTDGLKKSGPMWASADQIGKELRRTADRGGPIRCAPRKMADRHGDNPRRPGFRLPQDEAAGKARQARPPNQMTCCGGWDGVSRRLDFAPLQATKPALGGSAPQFWSASCA